MGYTRKILAQRELGAQSVFYTDVFRLDLAESLHLHLRNFRLELTLQEWKVFARGVLEAYARWWVRGKPGYQPTESHLNLFLTRVDPVAGRGEGSLITNECRVELSQFADYVHLHFRNTRYEFSVGEFLELADELSKAAQTLRTLDIMADYPKRIGFGHIMQPKGRVAQSQNPGGFVTHESRFPDENAKTYDSVVLDEASGQWQPQLAYPPRRAAPPPGLARQLLAKGARAGFKLLNAIFRFF